MLISQVIQNFSDAVECWSGTSISEKCFPISHKTENKNAWKYIHQKFIANYTVQIGPFQLKIKQHKPRWNQSNE